MQHPDSYNVFFLIIGIYSACATLILYDLYRRKKDISLKTMEAELKKGFTGAKEDLEKLKLLSEIQGNHIPWYERYLSTVGVIGFFTLTIATTVQTIKFESVSAESTAAERELDEYKWQIAEYASAAENISTSIVKQLRKTGRLSTEEKEVLIRQRDLYMQAKTLTDKQRALLYHMFIAIGDYKGFTDFYGRNTGEDADITRMNAADAVNLGTYALITGNTHLIRTIYDTHNAGYSTMPEAVRHDFLLIEYMYGDADQAVRRAAALNEVSAPKARKGLEKRKNHFIE